MVCHIPAALSTRRHGEDSLSTVIDRAEHYLHNSLLSIHPTCPQRCPQRCPHQWDSTASVLLLYDVAMQLKVARDGQRRANGSSFSCLRRSSDGSPDGGLHDGPTRRSQVPSRAGSTFDREVGQVIRSSTSTSSFSNLQSFLQSPQVEWVVYCNTLRWRPRSAVLLKVRCGGGGLLSDHSVDVSSSRAACWGSSDRCSTCHLTHHPAVCPAVSKRDKSGACRVQHTSAGRC